MQVDGLRPQIIYELPSLTGAFKLEEVRESNA